MFQLADAGTLLPEGKPEQYAKILTHAFKTHDMVELQEKLQAFVNRAPYVVQIKEEAQLQFMLYSIFALMGVVVSPEVMTSIGRADLVIEVPKFIYVIELKYNSSAEKALEQIHTKAYYKKFANANRQITLIGINFTQETATISIAWQTI